MSRSLRDALSLDLGALQERDLAPVTVAVIDSGVDATHPDLQGRVVRAYAVQTDGERCEVAAVDVPDNHDVYGHGTAVASIIAGIAPNAELVDIRVLDTDNVGTGAALVEGLRHAVMADEARVLNMSLAATMKFAKPLNDLTEKAYRKNKIVVASRRNMPLIDDGFPAEFSSAVSVDIGNFPSQLHLKFRCDHAVEYIAHGEEVVAAAPGGGYTTMTGTSFATPAVAAHCALIVGAFPELRPFEVKSVLRALAG